MIELILNDALWSALAATGFAILFNVPRRLLWGCALTGAVGHALRTVLVETVDMPLELATLFGAIAVGILAQWCARHWRVPAPVFAISGAIPMVPGLFAYSAMIAIIQSTTLAAPEEVRTLLTEGAVNMIRVALILGAIATGIVLPTLIFQREKPVV
ncbi:MAG: threonine/serine exporter family protein [Aggregatilineales bacterium]